MVITLTRCCTSGKGTFGMVSLNDTPLCVTCELPWNDNHPRTSCIPAGTYRFKKFKSPRHGWVWLAVNVPGRSMIEIHSANTIKDLEGCIAPGREFGRIKDFPAVLNSKSAMAMLREVLPDVFEMQIKEAYG